jgi:hypothetical protein
VQELQAKLTIVTNSPNATERATLQAALFYWLTGDHDQARSLMKKVLDMTGEGRSSSSSQTGNSGTGTSPMYNTALSMMGWIDVTSNQESLVAKSPNWFERVLEINPRDIDVNFADIHLYNAFLIN